MLASSTRAPASATVRPHNVRSTALRTHTSVSSKFLTRPTGTSSSRRDTRVAFMTERTEQGTQVKVGDSLPGDAALYRLEPQQEDQQLWRLKDIIQGKNVVIFGLPGAFTSVCSSKHLPGFNAKYDELRKAGVDTVCCSSINDVWVMDAWAKKMDVDPNKVLMLADGDGSFHRSLGLVQTLEGLGERPLRYSLYAEDGVVKVLNVDEAGPKSYKVSGPDHMLEDLAKLKSSKA